MKNVLLVGCGGFFGAAARYLFCLAAGGFYAGEFPLGTFLVNVLGAFLMGFLTQFLGTVYPENKGLSLLLTTGMLGGFTTFSTFSLETVRLAESGRLLTAVCSVALSVCCGLAGVVLGRALASVTAR